MLERLGPIYLESALEHLESISRGIQAGDHGSVALAAHSLKSSSATLGASHLAELCQVLENRARAEQLDALEETVDDLQGTLHRVCDSLAQECDALAERYADQRDFGT